MVYFWLELNILVYWNYQQVFLATDGQTDGSSQIIVS